MQSVVGYAGTPAGGSRGDVRACGGCRERIAGGPVRTESERRVRVFRVRCPADVRFFSRKSYSRIVFN